MSGAEPDPVEDNLERADNANSPEHALVFLQTATVHQLRKLTEQQTIANLVAVLSLEPHWADQIVDDSETILHTIREGLGL